MGHFLTRADIQETLGVTCRQLPFQNPHPHPCSLLATHHEVGGRARVGMPEVDGVHAEGLLQLVLVLDPVGFPWASVAEASPGEARLSRGLGARLPHSPEPGAVKMHHHPLGRVKGEGVSILDALQEPPELGAQEGSARVGSVDVKPQPFPGT